MCNDGRLETTDSETMRNGRSGLTDKLQCGATDTATSVRAVTSMLVRNPWRFITRSFTGDESIGNVVFLNSEPLDAGGARCFERERGLDPFFMHGSNSQHPIAIT